MRSILKTALVAAIAACVVAASLAIAQTGGGGGTDRQDEQRQEDRRGPGGPAKHRALGPGYLDGVADKLGVSADELRDALRAAREEVGPPERPQGDDPPSREEFEQQRQERCTEITNAVAEELDTDGDRVRDAFKSEAKERVDQAERDGDIPEDLADDLREKIDSDCFLPRPAGGPGCGPHGPGGPMGDGS